MSHTTPQRLIDLFTIADRTVTAELFTIANAIAAGSTTTSIVTESPAFVRALFPNLTDDDLNRVAVLAAWAQYVQHTCTVRELTRKWRLARTIGLGDSDGIDYALAQGAELCEQKFTEWCLELPRGGSANITDRLMSALAERIAGRVAAYMFPGRQPEGGSLSRSAQLAAYQASIQMILRGCRGSSSEFSTPFADVPVSVQSNYATRCGVSIPPVAPRVDTPSTSTFTSSTSESPRAELPCVHRKEEPADTEFNECNAETL